MQGHGLRDEERTVVAAMREGAIQGPKIRFIVKAFHNGISVTGEKSIIKDQVDSRLSRKWQPIFFQDV